MQFLTIDRILRDRVFYFKTQKLAQSVYNLGKSFWLVNENRSSKVNSSDSEFCLKDE